MKGVDGSSLLNFCYRDLLPWVTALPASFDFERRGSPSRLAPNRE